jgi:ribosomal protein S30
MYQEKKGNIPNLKNRLKYNMYFKENRYITKIEKDPNV